MGLEFEKVPFSLTYAVESVLCSLRNHPMSEDRLRDEPNELHLLCQAIYRIDPMHSQTKSLALPFLQQSPRDMTESCGSNANREHTEVRLVLVKLLPG